MNKSILHTSIDLLSRREHSIQEMQMKLKQREHQSDEIDEVIDYLIANDYLSEQRFAESMYRMRANKGFGKRYIENELMQKGIHSSLVREAAETLEIDWYEQVQAVYDKKYGQSEIKDQKDKAKRIRFLQYRGFSTDEIFAVLNLDEAIN